MTYLHGRSGKEVSEGEVDGEDAQCGTEMKSTIVWAVRLDAWIMTVLSCMASEDSRGGRLLNMCDDTFTELLTISVGQLYDELYDYVKNWVQEDLEIEGSARDGAADSHCKIEDNGKKKAFNST